METMKRNGVSTEERWARYCDIYKEGPIDPWIQHIEPPGLPDLMHHFDERRAKIYLETISWRLDYIEMNEADKDKYREHIMETGWTGCILDW
jgi:hypothetical protein